MGFSGRLGAANTLNDKTGPTAGGARFISIGATTAADMAEVLSRSWGTGACFIARIHLGGIGIVLLAWLVFFTLIAHGDSPQVGITNLNQYRL